MTEVIKRLETILPNNSSSAARNEAQPQRLGSLAAQPETEKLPDLADVLLSATQQNQNKIVSPTLEFRFIGSPSAFLISTGLICLI